MCDGKYAWLISRRQSEGLAKGSSKRRPMDSKSGTRLFCDSASRCSSVSAVQNVIFKIAPLIGFSRYARRDRGKYLFCFARFSYGPSWDLVVSGQSEEYISYPMQYTSHIGVAFHRILIFCSDIQDMLHRAVDVPASFHIRSILCYLL